jgi:trimethylamine--corrinoid protein Co-methyltransferase
VTVLSEEQIQEVHLASLEILERTGVEVRNARALQLLKQVGAHVRGQHVRIPPDLVAQAIRTAGARMVRANGRAGDALA